MDFDINEEIRKSEEILFKIFKIVTSEKEISSEKGVLLKLKVNTIDKNLENKLFLLVKNNYKNYNKIITLKFLNIILFIITFITVFFNPIIFLILLLIGIYNIFNIRKKMELFISDVEYLEKITKKIDNLNITIANCRRFLNSRTIKEDISNIENKKEKNVSDVKNIILANEAIEKVIGTGVIEDFSENLKHQINFLI